jgi:hypothetical protein
MTTQADWNDPGHTRLLREWQERCTVMMVDGIPIRLIWTRFGVVYAVTRTSSAKATARLKRANIRPDRTSPAARLGD